MSTITTAPGIRQRVHDHEPCHNCGMPSDCINGQGRRLRITFRATRRFERNRTRAVWCCSDGCAVQVLAVARYGPASYKWPIASSQFRALDPLGGPTVTKVPLETRINGGSNDGLFRDVDPEPIPGVSSRSGPFKRKNGRPRKWANPAERNRAYRRRRNGLTKEQEA
jgi:hypothetical protein